jgi:hypothetical protein
MRGVAGRRSQQPAASSGVRPSGRTPHDAGLGWPTEIDEDDALIRPCRLLEVQRQGRKVMISLSSG